MRLWSRSAAVLGVFGFVVSAWACDPKPAAGAQKTADAGHQDKAGCGASAKQVAGKDGAGKEGCHGAAKGQAVAGRELPRFLYKVGDQTVACPAEAQKIAAGDDAKIRYVVDQTEYGDKIEALKAYAGVLDTFYAGVTTVRYAVGEQCVGCPKAAEAMAKGSGKTVKYRVGAVVFTDKARAEEAPEAAREAAEKITLSYVVDGKSYAGAAEAETARAASGGEKKPCAYAVGDVRTPCEATAKVELAKARIQAAQRAIDQTAEQKVAEREVAAGP
jgi:hypothetical protein